MNTEVIYRDANGPFGILYLDDTDVFADECLNLLDFRAKEASVHSCNYCHKTFEDVDFPEEREYCLEVRDYRFDFPLEFCCIAHKRAFLISNVRGATCSTCNCRIVLENFAHFAYNNDFYCSQRCFENVFTFK